MEGGAPVVDEADYVVHMLWIGEGNIPDFQSRCIASWATAGNSVHLWTYPQQQRHLVALPENVTVRDANEILPLSVALDMGYYHGMGPQLRWPSWSTFADLFRYELLYEKGGWWCDADSIGVRCLRDAPLPRRGHVLATERWRPGGYRNITLAVPKPGSTSEGSRTAFLLGGNREEAKVWREAQCAKAVDCCVLTNSHIWAPRGSPLMRACADELRPLMEAYASQCRGGHLGDEAVDWALPTGGEGLRIFQEQAGARMSAPGPNADELLAGVQHYAVFNPVEIDDFAGAMRVLRGERPVPAAACAVHVFGLIRDNWKALRFEVPSTFSIVRDDHNEQLLTDIKKVEAAKVRAERQRAREVKAAVGSATEMP